MTTKFYGAMLRICLSQIHYDVTMNKLFTICIDFRNSQVYIRRVMQIKVTNNTNWWWPSVISTAGFLR